MKAFDPNYKLLDEMYQDNYYPTFLVDKVKDELQKVIALLDQKNAFSFRKSVPFVSKRLQVSRYTVYKYLGELAEQGGGNADEPGEL